jgi:hypothetical protein
MSNETEYSAAMDDFNAAVNERFPIPDNPHASVIERAHANRAAFLFGYEAAAEKKDAIIADLRAALAVESAALADAVRHVGNLKERLAKQAEATPVVAPIGVIKEGRFSNRFEWASDQIASDDRLIGLGVYTAPPAPHVEQERRKGDRRKR